MNLPPHARTLYSGEQIRERLADIARRILAAERVTLSRGITLVPVLEGAMPLCRDLQSLLAAHAPDVAVTVCPIRISRTRGTALRTPRIVAWDASTSQIQRRLALLLDDLIDKGHTLGLAHRILSELRPLKILRVVTVIKRHAPRDWGHPEHACFRLDYDDTRADATWLFGYGMDYEGAHRDLDGVAEMPIPTGDPS